MSCRCLRVPSGCWLCLGVVGSAGVLVPQEQPSVRTWEVVGSCQRSPAASNGYSLLIWTLLALMPSLGHFCTPSPCFLGSPPKSTLCPQILISGSAFLGTHTDSEIKRDLRGISVCHNQCLELPGLYLDPESNKLKKK